MIEYFHLGIGGSRYGGYYSGPVVLDDLLCSGAESNLTECSIGMGTHQCTDHTQDAGVRCMYESECEENSLRLVPREDLTAEQLYLNEGDLESYYFINDEIHRGRVEVCVGGEWVFVCHDEMWDDINAVVACRQLGFSPYGE